MSTNNNFDQFLNTAANPPPSPQGTPPPPTQANTAASSGGAAPQAFGTFIQQATTAPAPVPVPVPPPASYRPPQSGPGVGTSPGSAGSANTHFGTFTQNQSAPQPAPYPPAASPPVGSAPFPSSTSASPSPAPGHAAAHFSGSTLDTIIQYLGGATSPPPASAGDQVYSYDPQDNDVMLHSSRGMLRRWFSNRTYEYLTVRPNASAALAPFDVSVMDASHQPKVMECSFAITGLTGSDASNFVAGLLVPAAGQKARSNHDLHDHLRRHVSQWVNEYAVLERNTNGSDICRGMTGAQRTACSQFLARRASEVLGITASGGIFLPEQDLQLPPLRLHFEPIRLLDDVPDRLALDMEIILQPSDTRLAARVRQPLATFTQQLQQAVEHWLMRSCRLSTFCFNKATLQRDLTQYLDQHLRSQFGQSIIKLTLTPEYFFPRQYDIRNTYDSTGHVNPRNHPLLVHHTLVIDLADIAQLLSSGPRPSPAILASRDLSAISSAWNHELEKWTQDLLDRTTRKHLAGKEYTDVGLNFPAVADQIRATVEQEFLAIGIKAKQFITLPGDKQIEQCLSRNFTFATQEILCQTSESQVNYSLSAQVRFLVKNLATIQNYLLPGKSLEDEFVRATTQAITAKVRELSPEALYLGFDRPIQGSTTTTSNSFVPESRPSPEQQISMEIEKRLVQMFGASNLQISLRPEESVVTQLDRTLRPPRDRCCTIKVQTVGTGAEEITFHIYYRVMAIAPGGWPLFQGLCRNVQNNNIGATAQEIGVAMDDKIGAECRIRFRGLPSHLALGTAPEMQTILLKYGPHNALQEISTQFGLTVEVTRIDRDPVESETVLGEFGKEKIQALLTDYRNCTEEITRLMQQHGGDHPLIDDMRSRQRQLDEQITLQLDPHQDYHKDAPLSLHHQTWQQRLGIPPPAPQLPPSAPPPLPPVPPHAPQAAPPPGPTSP